MRSKNKKVQYKRKEQGRTNYKKRLRFLLAKTPRVVVRKSLKNLSVQIIQYNRAGDVVLCAGHSRELEKYGWPFGRKNIPASYLTGYLLGKRASIKNIKRAILDIGFNTSTKGNRVYAAIKGMLDAGIDVPHNEQILPDAVRLSGKHIVDFSKKRSDKGLKIESLPQVLETVKKKIAAEVKNGEKER